MKAVSEFLYCLFSIEINKIMCRRFLKTLSLPINCKRKKISLINCLSVIVSIMLSSISCTSVVLITISMSFATNTDKTTFIEHSSSLMSLVHMSNLYCRSCGNFVKQVKADVSAS